MRKRPADIYNYPGDDNGYIVLRFWEYDIKKNVNIYLDKIKHFIGGFKYGRQFRLNSGLIKSHCNGETPTISLEQEDNAVATSIKSRESVTSIRENPKKDMTCSVLHSNMQSVAEMTTPLVDK